MTFIEFLNSTAIYAWFVVALVLIIIVAYGIKLYLHSRKLKKEIEIDAETDLPSEKELKGMLKELEKKKTATLTSRSDKKVKKVKEKVIEVLEDTPSSSWHPVKTKGFFTFARWREWYLDKYHPGKIVLINMELNNGFHRLFTVKEKDEGFVFRGKKFLFDDEYKFYNIDAKLYTFDFHEGIVLPVKRKIPLTGIKKRLESSDEIDIEYAINPSTLQRFMTAKIAEGVMRGTQLDEFMRKLQMFLLVTMIAVLVHLALFLYASGILQNLKVPGIIG